MAALLLVALLLGAGARAVTGVGGHTGGAGSWSPALAARVQTDVVAACQQASGTVADCGCVFRHLRATAPYDTPAGLIALDSRLRRYAATHDATLLPAPYTAAVGRCLSLPV